MQRQRGELVPIGDALAGLDGPATAIRDDSPQARHHFTQADQGTSASEEKTPIWDGADDGALLAAPHQYRRSDSV